MTSPSALDALARLGLHGLDPVTEPARFAWSASDQSQALGRGDVASLAFSVLAASGFVDLPFATVRDAALGRLDAAVSAPAAGVVRFAAPAHMPLHVRVPADVPEDEVAYVPEEDPGTAYVDLTRAGACVVRAGADTVLVRATAEGIDLQALAPVADPLFLAMPPTLDAWVTACRDPWLAGQVAPLAAAPDTWTRVVGAGMLARLAMPADAAEARAWLDAFRRGDVDESTAGPRRWARALSRDDLDAIVRHARTECAGLSMDLEDAAVDVHASLEGWEDVVRELAHRRDDLEGVRLLLHVAGAAATLHPALEVLDREGASLRLSIPRGAPVQDERLQRAALKDPDAWWGLAG